MSFPDTQFQISNYYMCRKDRNKIGGDLFFHVNQDLNCKIVNTYSFATGMDILPPEPALKRRWLNLVLHKRNLCDQKFLFQM